jgi:hypothetical protein
MIFMEVFINIIMKIILIVVLLFLAACSTTPKNPEAWMEREINACLPTAIAFRESLRKYNVWAEVFRYSYYDDKNKLRGHAMVAYLYPSGQNQLWTYDNMGSYRIRAFTNDVASIAQLSHSQRGMTNKTFAAEYIR